MQELEPTKGKRVTIPKRVKEEFEFRIDEKIINGETIYVPKAKKIGAEKWFDVYYCALKPFDRYYDYQRGDDGVFYTRGTYSYKAALKTIKNFILEKDVAFSYKGYLCKPIFYCGYLHFYNDLFTRKKYSSWYKCNFNWVREFSEAEIIKEIELLVNEGKTIKSQIVKL